jgi:Asp/Glu/hydantoin racemase
MAAPRIALIHATPLSLEPIRAAFAELWPAARTTNLLDDSLSADLAAAGVLDQAMMDRFATLADYVTRAGADAILFTCSAFGVAIDAVKAHSRIPVLKPNEAMMDEALDAAVETGGRIGLLATFGPSIPSMREEFEALAAGRHRPLDLVVREVPGAMAALGEGRAEEHDRRIAEAASEMDDSPILVLAQFSMARAKPRVPAAPGRIVLTSPHSAVKRLQALL